MKSAYRRISLERVLSIANGLLSCYSSFKRLTVGETLRYNFFVIPNPIFASPAHVTVYSVYLVSRAVYGSRVTDTNLNIGKHVARTRRFGGKYLFFKYSGKEIVCVRFTFSMYVRLCETDFSEHYVKDKRTGIFDISTRFTTMVHYSTSAE